MKIFVKILSLFTLIAITATAVMSCSDKPYRYDYNLSEYVTVAKYKDIPVKTFEYTVTEEDVRAQILLCRSEYSDIETVERPARAEDIVYINYESRVDGMQSENGSYENVELVLSSKTFIDGFEDALIGLSAGDKVTIDLTFPDPYPANPKLSGFDVTFEVEINEVCEQTLPEYNAEFVKKYYGYDSIEEFEEGVYNSVKQSYEDMLLNYKVSQTWEYVMDNSKVKRIPVKEYDEVYEDQLNYYTSLAAEEDMTLSKYVTNVLEYSSDAEFYSQLQRDCEDWIFEEMVLYYIARKENIKISEKEYQKGALDYAHYYELNSVEELEQFFSRDNIKENLLFDKVLTFVADSGKIEK